jgi:hypothetical protein
MKSLNAIGKDTSELENFAALLKIRES